MMAMASNEGDRNRKIRNTFPLRMCRRTRGFHKRPVLLFSLSCSRILVLLFLGRTLRIYGSFLISCSKKRIVL
ncbi:hypothetical protein KCV00_g167, partial [Aureobasidium melanogenum]